MDPSCIANSTVFENMKTEKFGASDQEHERRESTALFPGFSKAVIELGQLVDHTSIVLEQSQR